MERMDTLVRTNPSGLLDVTLSSRVYRDVFSPDVIIACDVTIPNTDFYVREELTTFHHSREYHYRCIDRTRNRRRTL